MKILQYAYFEYASNYPWNSSEVRDDSDSCSNKYRIITATNGSDRWSKTNGEEQSKSGRRE